MKWNIAMVNGFFYPYIGGTEKHMYELGRRLAKTNNMVVLTSQLENTKSQEKLEDMNVYRVKAKLMKIPNIYPPPYPRTKEVPRMIAKLHDEYKFDFINMHGRWFINFTKAFKFAEKHDIKTTLTLHNGRPIGINLTTSIFGLTYDALIGKRVLKQADRIIAVSAAVKEDMAKYGIDESKISVIHNGVDTMTFKPSDPTYKRKYPQFDTLLLFLGRIIPQKGLIYLIEAMENIVKEHPKAGLLIVGKGKLKPKLMEIVKKKNLEKNIIFPGFIPEEELSNLYSSADIFVLPSLWEVLPISLLEALSCGAPLISSDASGNPEIVDDGKNGYVVAKRDAKTLRDRIINLIEDESKRKEMGRMSREIAINKFEWDLITKKTHILYDEMGND